MIIAQPMLGVDPELPLWRVFLFVSQLGAILAVVAYFARPLCRRVFLSPLTDWRGHILTKLLLAMIPTVVIGLLLDDFMEAHFENVRTGPPATALALIVGAFAILWIDRRFRSDKPMSFDDVTLKQAFWIGVMQCLSMWPGTSRAAATIMGGMLLGLTPRVATEFSFYLAIPTMVAAGGWRLFKYRGDLSADMLGVVLVGTAVAFVVALAVIAAFMGYVRKHRFTPFAIYRIALGTVVLLWYLRR